MKSKKILAVLLSLMLLVGMLSVSAYAVPCTIYKLPSKVVYFEGEQFKSSGLRLKKSVGSGYITSGFDLSPIENNDVLELRDGEEVSVYTITVSHQGDVAGTFDITVYKAGLISAPTKTEYRENETFDPTGLRFYGSYRTGDIREITWPATDEEANTKLSFEPSLDTPLTKDVTEVVINYAGREVARIPVTVTSAMNADLVNKVYTDSDKFDPSGLSVTIDSTAVIYPMMKDNFSFKYTATGEEVSTTALLTVDEANITRNVTVYYNGEEKGNFDITVDHDWGEIVQLEGGTQHARFCKGCGQMADMDACADHVTEWIANNDGGFFKQQTESGVCAICGGKVTRYIPGSETFSNALNITDETPATELKMLYYFYMIIVSLVQSLIPAGGHGHVFGTGIFK